MFQRAECAFREKGDLCGGLTFANSSSLVNIGCALQMNFFTRKSIDFPLVSPSPGSFLDEATIALRHKPLPPAARHLSDHIVIDDARLSAPHDPALKHQVSLRDVNADVTHHVIDALEASTHLVNCDHKAAEKASQQLAHCLLSFVMHAFNDHVDSLKHQLVMEVWHLKIKEASTGLSHVL